MPMVFAEQKGRYQEFCFLLGIRSSLVVEMDDRSSHSRADKGAREGVRCPVGVLVDAGHPDEGGDAVGSTFYPHFVIVRGDDRANRKGLGSLS